MRQHERRLLEMQAVRAGDIDRVDSGVLRQCGEVGVDAVRAVLRGKAARFISAPRTGGRIMQFPAFAGGFEEPAGDEIRADRRKPYHGQFTALK